MYGVMRPRTEGALDLGQGNLYFYSGQLEGALFSDSLVDFCLCTFTASPSATGAYDPCGETSGMICPIGRLDSFSLCYVTSMAKASARETKEEKRHFFIKTVEESKMSSSIWQVSEVPLPQPSNKSETFAKLGNFFFLKNRKKLP